jgi:GT2 family glycosyltransferase
MVTTKNRPTELALLMQSLRTQTHQDFDLYILDDASQNPSMNNYFVNYLIQKLKLEGHKVMMIQNNIGAGVCRARQQLVDYVLKNSTNPLMGRLDDDVILEPDYISKLVNVIQNGYDIASGVTPHIIGNRIRRETKFVSPVINRVVLNNDGSFLINSDDCGFEYTESKILTADHFRSCMICKREVHDQIEYEDNLTNVGFREEEFFSFRAILKGFKIGVDTSAKVQHLVCPSGGTRNPNYGNDTLQDHKVFNRFVKKIFAKHGDFIEAYHKRLGLDDLNKLSNLNKENNLIYSREE